jgi:hypothetical protein
LAVGAETYGGLGDTSKLTLANTSHYVAPLLGWAFAGRSWLSFSPGFGTTDGSLDMVFRLKIAHEFDHFGGWFSGHDEYVGRISISTQPSFRSIAPSI